MMTPKQTWIFNFLCVFCRQCSRRRRIFERLQEEIKDDDFDKEKDEKATKIIREEA